MFVRDFRGARVWCEADKGGGDSSGSSSTTNVEESFQRALDKRNNDGVKLARELFDDNYRLRQDKSRLSAEVETLRGKVPAEGGITLTPAEAAAWAAYKALGSAEDVQKGIEDRNKLQGELDTIRRESAIREAAEAAGYKFVVLADRDKVARAEGKQLAFEVREVDRDGGKARVPYVKEGDKEFLLSEYAETNWSEFLPALVSQSQKQQTSGTQFLPQYGSAGGNKPAAPKEVAQRTLDKAYKRKPVTEAG